MKAAILHHYGQPPRYGEWPAPVPQSATQVLLRMSAAAVKNLDKAIAAGTH